MIKKFKFSKESRKRMSLAHIGKKFTEEHKKHLSLANKGHISWAKGKHFSKEHKHKISEAHKGKKHSEETKRKLSLMKKGKPGLRGEKSPNWKGGKKKRSDGYVYIYKPGHPYCKSHKYIFEHRLVVEKQIGRYLLPTEVIHHLGAKDDNRPQMLMAFVNNVVHQRFEQDGKVNSKDIIFDGRQLHALTSPDTM